MGPGLAIHPLPFANRTHITAYGGIFMRLGVELSTGCEVDWKYAPTSKGTALSAPLAGEATAEEAAPSTVAVMQFTYSTCPKGQLRAEGVMVSAVEDTLAAVAHMRERYPTGQSRSALQARQHC